MQQNNKNMCFFKLNIVNILNIVLNIEQSHVLKMNVLVFKTSCWLLAILCLILQPQRLQPIRLLCPLFPGVGSNSCTLSRWCYLTISSSAAPFPYCL